MPGWCASVHVFCLVLTEAEEESCREERELTQPCSLCSSWIKAGNVCPLWYWFGTLETLAHRMTAGENAGLLADIDCRYLACVDIRRYAPSEDKRGGS